MSEVEASIPTTEWIRRLPKVELHLHLEGAIPLDALWELVKKYGRAAELGGIEALKSRFRYRDFPHFIETWIWKNGFLREYEDFTFVAGRVAEDLASQNIWYVEAFYSPGDFAHHNLEAQRLTEAIRKGLRSQEKSITVPLIADLNRDLGPKRGAATVEALADARELGVIGIGLGGSEQQFPPEPYRAIYERARSLGFQTTAHAGEAAGPESIWSAVRELRVDRIGHGVRAVEDPRLMAHLRERQIPVEMCPVSNVRTGVVSDMRCHPIREFYDQGILVSVNTDDPKMFDSSLELEYTELNRHLGFRWQEVRTLIKNGIRSLWCDDGTKSRLEQELVRAGGASSTRPA